jgi:putative component of membrane protein insertase Oxa1/YidC/SpoIIIJ protein YidD
MNGLLDSVLALVAVIAIRVYQLTYSRVHGRTCLFRPTCSHRAITLFRTHGFAEGLRRTRRQLSECCGEYSMRLNQIGNVELLTRSGEVVPEEQVNPSIVARMEFARTFATAAGTA